MTKRAESVASDSRPPGAPGTTSTGVPTTTPQPPPITLATREAQERAVANAPRVPFLRPERGRVIAGVCAGLAANLRVRVLWVRLAMVLLALLGGAGVALYLFWWLTIPSGDPYAAAAASRPAALTRLAGRLRGPEAGPAIARREVVLGLVLLAVATVLIAVRAGWQWQQSWIPPAMLIGGGLLVAWSQMNSRFDDGSAVSSAGGSATWRGGFVRLVGGLVLVAIGAFVFLGQDTPWRTLLQTGAAMLALLLGVVVVFAPWWLRMAGVVSEERAAKAREAERADIAAHLHDSVLQTLALIRANAASPVEVERLARSQERELRRWLYMDRAASSSSVAEQLREMVAAVEDGTVGKTGQGAPVDLVVVGDVEPSANSDALLGAVREALVNAVAHGAPPVSVYFEVSASGLEAFIRDRGDGFDIAAVAPDRMGVRESIIGRLERRGGSAEIVSRPNWGTEIRLKLPT
ncbi:MAG: PspC domain-containing protein [Promicromonosporaceae bacterium]|nr:PspC domain-containing protein [Promicromonosporaceae bacterium]